MTPKVHIRDLGRNDYKATWDLQEEVFKGIVQSKIARRNAGLDPRDQGPEGELSLALPESHLFWVEHPHVLTLGKSGEASNVVVPEARLKELGVQYYPINRGGDITYHGPGQIVGYPILDLDQFFTDIHKYLRFLEEAVIRTCAEYGVSAGRIEGLTGVWVDHEAGLAARKICAFGVKCSRWVTMHGLAFNVNTDLSFFNLIVPCGISDRGVTSLSAEVGRTLDQKQVQGQLQRHLQDLFGWAQA